MSVTRNVYQQHIETSTAHRKARPLVCIHATLPRHAGRIGLKVAGNRNLGPQQLCSLGQDSSPRSQVKNSLPGKANPLHHFKTAAGSIVITGPKYKPFAHGKSIPPQGCRVRIRVWRNPPQLAHRRGQPLILIFKIYFPTGTLNLTGMGPRKTSSNHLIRKIDPSLPSALLSPINRPLTKVV